METIHVVNACYTWVHSHPCISTPRSDDHTIKVNRWKGTILGRARWKQRRFPTITERSETPLESSFYDITRSGLDGTTKLPQTYSKPLRIGMGERISKQIMTRDLWLLWLECTVDELGCVPYCPESTRTTRWGCMPFAEWTGTWECVPPCNWDISTQIRAGSATQIVVSAIFQQGGSADTLPTLQVMIYES